MIFRKVLALRGPNIWSRHTVLEAWVDLGALKDTSSAHIPGFNDRLMSWLPTMIEHRCSVGERGGFFQRLRWGTYLAHILEHTTLELQTLCGTPVGYGRARETSEEGLFKVAIRYQEESLGRACLETARDLLMAAVFDLPFDIDANLKRLREFADRVCLGPSTNAIVDAARARNIPARRLNAGSLVQFGQGKKQRRIWTAETDLTSAIAESIAQDKQLTKTMLAAAGIPVPEGREVESPEDAWNAAQAIEGPVVVKPVDGNHGRGVCMNLTDEQQIKVAYGEALKEGSGVIVERFASGAEHRLLVVGKKLIAAAAGDAVSVIGDGQHTIRELIELQVNSDPRRGDDETKPLDTLKITPLTMIELEHQGFTPDSVPPADVKVIVRRIDNLSRDVTDIVHPTVAEHVVLAAQVVGLDIAGIDLVTQDISRPLEEQGGVIVEVNAGPGLLMHLKPEVGSPRPVGEAIVDHLFPDPNDNGRIPVVSVTGTNGKTTVARLVTSILKASGRTVGLACTDGITIDGRTIEHGDCAGPRSARNVLLNPILDAAVFEAARGGILREGLGFDKCDVAIVTNIGEGDHLGLQFIDSPKEMFKVKRTPVDVVMPTGTAVLNATDPLVVEMKELSAGSVTFFALDPMHPVIRAHRDAGHRAVVVRDGQVVLSDGTEETSLVALEDLPCTHGGRVDFQTENVLAATAAGWALGLSLNEIRNGLQSFQGNLQDDPARFNVLESAEKTIVVMDGRNRSALAAVIAAIDHFPHSKRSVIYSAEEDRRELDIVQQGQQLGASFDRVFLCEIENGVDRPVGEVTRLLRSGVEEGSRVQAINEIRDWSQAVDAAWRELQSGELLLIQSSTVPKTVKKLQTLLGLEPAEAAA
ncbi:cyanophycin synthetase [Schlesneria paludicola]|uniref:cyanophycin synthetase n=1 Tax=Schlesneria paludicola TaxID=360056 RepID=UPI00029A712C|nr:cyanophycin synthetase [Schlesneria paludicola]